MIWDEKIKNQTRERELYIVIVVLLTTKDLGEDFFLLFIPCFPFFEDR